MAEIGTGTVITFETGFFAEILDVSPPGASREAIDTSHMDTSSSRTFMPGDLVDRGEMTVEIAFDPSVSPPIDGAASSVVITFPGGETWTFSGFMTGYEPSVPLEDRMTATCTIKASGGIEIG